MAITFHLRSDSLTPYRALGDGTPVNIFDAAAGATAPAIVADATSGIINSTVIELKHATLVRGLQFRAGANIPSTGPLTIRVRLQPRFTGNPGANCMLVSAEGYGVWNSNIIWLYLDTAGHLVFVVKDPYGAVYVNITSSVFSPTVVSGTPIEFMAVWDGTNGAGGVKLSCNGASISTHTASANAAAWNPNAFAYVGIGFSSRFAIANIDINEVVIYNTAETYTYTPSGTTFVTDTAFNGGTNTGAGAGNIVSGATETIAGVTVAGTAVVAVASTTKTGVTANDGTGTYDGSDRWTVPAAYELLSGVQLKNNSTSLNLTGTLTSPTAAQIAAYILDSDNVETGLSLRKAIRLILSAMAGKVSGAPAGPITIRDINDTKDRIVATVDANGNRLALTYDET